MKSPWSSKWICWRAEKVMKDRQRSMELFKVGWWVEQLLRELSAQHILPSGKPSPPPSWDMQRAAVFISYCCVTHRHKLAASNQTHPLACGTLGRYVGGLGWVLCLGSHKAEMKVLVRLGFCMEGLKKMLLPGSFSCWQSSGGWVTLHCKRLVSGLAHGSSIFKARTARWILPSIWFSLTPSSATEKAPSFKGSPGWVRPTQIISVL